MSSIRFIIRSLQRLPLPGFVQASEYLPFYAGLLVLVGMVYSFSLQNGFLSGDDYLFVRDNSRLAMPFWQIPSLFAEPLPSPEGLPPSNYYRPMLMLLHVAVYRVWGASAVGFHLTNIFLHAAGTLFVFRTGLILFGRDWRKALLGAALFAVHPVHNQTVGAVGLGDALYGMLLISTLYFFLTKQRIASYITFVLALFAKEVSVVFPVVLLVFAAQERGVKKALPEMAPYAAAAGAYLAARSAVVGFIPQVAAAELFPGQLLTMLAALFDYLRLLVLPYPLQPYYPQRWYSSVFDPRVLASVLAMAPALWMLYAGRKDRTAVFLSAALFLMLLPAVVMVNTFPFGDAYAYIAERYLYMPSVFYCLLAGLITVRVFEKTSLRFLLLFGIGIVAIFSVLNVYSSRVWQNNFTYYGAVIRDFPETAIAHSGLGYAYEEAGLAEEAGRQYRLASDLLYAEGMKYLENGLCMRAIPKLVTAAQIAPGNAEVHYRLGSAYAGLGLLNDAIGHYLHAVELAPGNAEVLFDLGVAYEKKLSSSEAAEAYAKASAIAPDIVRKRQQGSPAAGSAACRD